MLDFLTGAMAMASIVAALFFLKFWRDTGDRLFAMFSAAFLLMGTTRFFSAFLKEPVEGQSYLYWIRLAAFLLILWAVVDKNRR